MIPYIIDLHGLDSTEAVSSLETASISLDEGSISELVVITGNGFVLKDLTFEWAIKKGYEVRYENGNKGTIIIY
ncbi:MAG: hypothetical protein K4H23_01625 [Mollicutes bacterium PWAP]|nr:hypothetical protein [Mollicutes bacterium PWAP]